VIFRKQTCKYCCFPLSNEDHGNRLRCRDCSIIHHREVSRFRQSIIRQIGNQGLKNYKILETLTSNHNWEAPIITTISKLIKKGFSFSRGGETYNTDDAIYPRVFVVLQFDVYYHPDSLFSEHPTNPQSVIIKKNK
jgi:hypothetical protein